MAVDATQHDLAECDQAIEQRDRGDLSAERGLRLRPPSEFAIEILKRVLVRNDFHIAFGKS